MKVYVAAKFSNKERVRGVYALLQSAGHIITHDWTNNLQATPFSLNPDFTAKYAREDINAVLAAEVFILLTSNEPSPGTSQGLGDQ